MRRLKLRTTSLRKKTADEQAVDQNAIAEAKAEQEKVAEINAADEAKKKADHDTM